MMCKWIQAELDHALAKKGARKWQKSRYNKAICSSSLGKSDHRPRCEGDDLQPAFAMDHQRFGSTHGYVGVSGNGWLPSTMAIWIGLMLRPHDCLPAMPDSKQPQPQFRPQWPLHHWWPIKIDIPTQKKGATWTMVNLRGPPAAHLPMAPWPRPWGRWGYPWRTNSWKASSSLEKSARKDPSMM